MTTPRLIDPRELAGRLDEPELCLVDLRAAHYGKAHIPGAQPLSLPALVRSAPPVMGLLPDPAGMAHVLGTLGITDTSFVVAYDDEGGGWASRLLWNLEAYGHERLALLDGGWMAWSHERFPKSTTPVYRSTTVEQPPVSRGGNVADRQYILDCIGDPDVRLLDTRSPAEYRGLDRRAARAGHIPGAVNLEWTEFMDEERNLRLRPAEDLRAQLLQLDLRPEYEIINYCQTNHRSALVWLALRTLGYPRVRNYDGSWSDWGNAPDTPIE